MCVYTYTYTCIYHYVYIYIQIIIYIHICIILESVCIYLPTWYLSIHRYVRGSRYDITEAEDKVHVCVYRNITIRLQDQKYRLQGQ